MLVTRVKWLERIFLCLFLTLLIAWLTALCQCGGGQEACLKFLAASSLDHDNVQVLLVATFLCP